MFAQSPLRHDNLGDAKERTVNVLLTRFFVANDFSKRDVFKVLAQKLQSLPVTYEHARKILPYMFTGSLFDGARKQKAGLAETSQCDHCGEEDTLLHSFKTCSHLQPPQVPGHVPNTSWVTGIIFESLDDATARLKRFNDLDAPILPGPFELRDNLDVFIDGSCYRTKSKRFTSAAVGVHSPVRGTFAFPLRGPDHSSQRAELWALAVALKMFSGNLCVFSDCSNVVQGFHILQSSQFDISLLHSWDNFDLWTEIRESALARPGTVKLFKVAAHGRSQSQSVYLTSGNAKADQAAKTCAARHFDMEAEDLNTSLGWVLDLQIHLVRVFWNQSRKVLQEYDEILPENPQPRQVSRGLACSCPPKHRLSKKSRVTCLGQCLFAAQDVSLEQAFLNLLSQNFVPPNVWDRLKARYPSFNAWLDAGGALVAPKNIDEVQPPQRRKTSNLDFIRRSFYETQFFNCGFTPWAFFMIDTVASQGFLPGFLTGDLSFGLLVTRFRCHWLHFLHSAFPNIKESKTARHGAPFGLPTLTAFGLRLKPRNPVAIWSALIQAVLFCNKESVGFAKCRSHWKPDWDLIV